MSTNKLYINGKWQESQSNETIEVINPATEEVIGEVPKATHGEIDDAVEAAKKAFPAWNELSAEERAAYINKIRDGIEERHDELAETVVAELGATRTFSNNTQVDMSIQEIDGLLEELKNFEFEEQIENAEIIYEGFGVVACITPWNYPLNQIQRKIIPALLTGNTVVVKPASDTPLTAMILTEIIDEAGLPEGVYNLVTGSGSDTGDYLAAHPDVSVISFTGSTDVGRGLYEKASTQIKKLVLELGGKSPLIYLKGGDLNFAVKKSMDTILNNQGQSCSALTRLIVPADELDTVKETIKTYYEENAIVGDPTDSKTKVGPMVSRNQQKTVLDYIEIGKKEGANIFLGGEPIDGPGYYVQPTIFTEVDNSMRIAQEEIFGPVLVVITYDAVEEAIQIANDTVYGLSGAVVGPTDTEAEKIARQIRTGTVYVNKGPRNQKAPFGGYKQSGLGREVGRFALEDYLEVKTIFKE